MHEWVHGNTVFLSLGSNQGDRKRFLELATELIGKRAGRVVGSSPLYETAPWGDFAEGEDLPFLNQALQVETALAPEALLAVTQSIEQALGRVRAGDSDTRGASRLYEARPIDIDIIFYGSQVIDSPALTLPHPKMHLRRFVLQPLCDLVPQFVHPLFHKTLYQLSEECPDTSSLSCCS